MAHDNGAGQGGHLFRGGIFHAYHIFVAKVFHYYHNKYMEQEKKIFWIGSTYRDLTALPQPVQRHFGFALGFAQNGLTHDSVKPLKGIKGGPVEIVANHDKNTYRAVYTAKIADVIVVLHVFQKKSKRGVATPQQDLDLIRQRLKDAKELLED